MKVTKSDVEMAIKVIDLIHKKDTPILDVKYYQQLADLLNDFMEQRALRKSQDDISVIDFIQDDL